MAPRVFGIAKFIGATALLLCGLAVSGPINAATLEVCDSGCPFATIQEALNNAADGDTIDVLDPVHTENGIVFQEQAIDSIIIKGQGRDTTIVQAAAAPSEANEFVLYVGPGKTATVQDIHLRHGGGYLGIGGAVICDAATLRMEGVRVSGNRAAFGGGMMLAECTGTRFHDIVVENNEASVDGGGVYFQGFSGHDVDITESVFRNNRAGRYAGGIMYSNPFSVLRLDGSDVSANEAQGLGGGAWIDFDVEAHITNSVFSHNVAGDNGGGLWVRQSTVHIEDSTFSHNQGLFGGGIENDTSFVDIVGSTISHNRATIGGGGINVDDFGQNSARLQLRNSTVSNNTATDYGSAIAVFATGFGFAEAFLVNTTVADNAMAETAPFPQAITRRAGDLGISNVYFVNSIVANQGVENCGTIDGEIELLGSFEDFGSSVFTDDSCGLGLVPVYGDGGGRVLVGGPRAFLGTSVSLLSNADEDGSGGVSPGDTLTFSFTASNGGETELSNVFIDGFAFGPLGELDCAPPLPATLFPGEAIACTATYLVTPTDEIQGLIFVSAEAYADQLPFPSFDEAVVPVGVGPGLSLSTSLQANADEDGSGNISFGDTLTFEVSAVNSGATDLNGVFIDDFYGGLDCTTPQPAFLAPGETLTCTNDYVVSASDALSGRGTFGAAAFAAELPFPVFDETAFPVLGPRPLLGVNTTLVSNADEDGSGTLTAGDTLSLGFTAENQGELGLTSVQVVPWLPGLGALDCAPVQPTDLDPGEGVACHANYEVTEEDEAAGSLFVVATAFSDQLESEGSELFLPVGGPGLLLSVEMLSYDDADASGDVTPGDTLNIGVEVDNLGATPLLNLIVVSEEYGPVCGEPTDLPAQESLNCTDSFEVPESASGGVLEYRYFAQGESTAPNSLVNADPKLGPLQDNGGPTQTHGFRFADSPAIDRNGQSDCGEESFFLTDVDQREVARPQGAACDSGAFEMDPFDAVQSQIAIVAELLAAGDLNAGQANSLTKKLEGALGQLLEGRTKPAVNKLGAFINEVEDFIATGRISEEFGASMVATAQWVIEDV